MKAQILSAAAVAALAFGASQAANAQSIDYGSLQQLFNEPVTTSATGSPQRSTDAPVDMTIITAEDIKRSGATDLPTILSRVPGIDILNWSAGDSDVSVRGYDQAYSSRLLVLINGRQVYLDNYGFTTWSTLPVSLNEIRQIEVVRGPNSALFGFNAVGGVINIITYNPKYDNVHEAEVHGGTQSDFGGSVVDTFKFGNAMSLRLSAGGERQDQWENSAGFPNVWNAHGMFDGSAQLGPKTELRVQGSLSKSYQDDFIPSDLYSAINYTTKSLMGTLNSDTPFGAIQIQPYVNTLRYSPPGADVKEQIEVVSLQDLLKVGTRNTFRIAFEYRDNLINTQTSNTGHVGYDVLAPSLMWNYAATDTLAITVAGRLDSLDLRRSGTIAAGFPFTIGNWNRTINAFSANVGAVYKPTGVDTLRATYARGIGVPTLSELGGIQIAIGPAPEGLAISGNPNIDPTVVSNYQISYDRALPALAATVGIKGFFQTTDALQGQWDFAAPDLAPTATTDATTLFENASNSKMAGFELSAKGKLSGGLHWSGDTTYTNVSDTVIGGYNLLSRRLDYAATTPKYRGNVAFGWSDSRWSLDAFVHYVTRYDAYNIYGALVQSPSYATLSARVAYLLPMGITAALSGQNLATNHQIQGSPDGLRAPRRILASLSKTW